MASNALNAKQIRLSGCTPTPLAAYLKGIALLRLLSRKEPTLRAAWRGECLYLETGLGVGAITDWLLNQYAPTPILAPWNGDSGFYEKGKRAIEAIGNGGTNRLAAMRNAIETAEALLAGSGRSASPKDSAKRRLLVRLRAEMPDDALAWMDAAIVLVGDPRFPPLLGTGGNDGRLDFTNNFMQRVCDLMDPDTGEPTARSSRWLDQALFGTPAPDLTKNAIGQFSPMQAGGPNASTGYKGDSRINPWDFVLMIEGALPFAAAATRRNESDDGFALSYPFTVRTTAAGSGGLASQDAGTSRGELWMPLWRNFASLSEVQALLNEGRVSLGRRPARDALDFVRAVHRLGGYRGVDRYQRFGLLMRAGEAFLATPLERVQVSRDPGTRWIDELDGNGWLARFQRFAREGTAANRIVALRRRLEDALFDLARRSPSRRRVQSLLALLGEIQFAIAVSEKGREHVDPVPRLGEAWVEAGDDQGPAFRIACALAGLRGVGDQVLPLACHLFPVHPRMRDRWIDNACSERADDACCRFELRAWHGGSLVDNLIDLARRRLWLAERLEMRDKPFDSRAGAGLGDLEAFLCDPRLDRDIRALIPGLALCSLPRFRSRSDAGVVPPAFALMKLTATPDRCLRALDRLGEDQTLKPSAELFAGLAAGCAQRAIAGAERCLRTSGIATVFNPGAVPRLAGISPRRAAAALAIPLSYAATAALAGGVLAAPEDEAPEERAA